MERKNPLFKAFNKLLASFFIAMMLNYSFAMAAETATQQSPCSGGALMQVKGGRPTLVSQKDIGEGVTIVDKVSPAWGGWFGNTGKTAEGMKTAENQAYCLDGVDSRVLRYLFNDNQAETDTFKSYAQAVKDGKIVLGKGDSLTSIGGMPKGEIAKCTDPSILFGEKSKYLQLENFKVDGQIITARDGFSFKSKSNDYNLKVSKISGEGTNIVFNEDGSIRNIKGEVDPGAVINHHKITSTSISGGTKVDYNTAAKKFKVGEGQLVEIQQLNERGEVINSAIGEGIEFDLTPEGKPDWKGIRFSGEGKRWKASLLDGRKIEGIGKTSVYFADNFPTGISGTESQILLKSNGEINIMGGANPAMVTVGNIQYEVPPNAGYSTSNREEISKELAEVYKQQTGMDYVSKEYQITGGSVRITDLKSKEVVPLQPGSYINNNGEYKELINGVPSPNAVKRGVVGEDKGTKTGGGIFNYIQEHPLKSGLIAAGGIGIFAIAANKLSQKNKEKKNQTGGLETLPPAPTPPSM